MRGNKKVTKGQEAGSCGKTILFFSSSYIQLKVGAWYIHSLSLVKRVCLGKNNLISCQSLVLRILPIFLGL